MRDVVRNLKKILVLGESSNKKRKHSLGKISIEVLYVEKHHKSQSINSASHILRDVRILFSDVPGSFLSSKLSSSLNYYNGSTLANHPIELLFIIDTFCLNYLNIIYSIFFLKHDSR